MGSNPLTYVDPEGLTPAHAGRIGWAIGGGLNSLAYHVTGATLSTMLVDAIWNIVHNDEAGSGESEGEASKPESCPNDGKKKKQREKGDSWTSDQDAEEQFQGIDREQRRRRSKNKDNTSIESTRKSRDRANHSLKPHNIDY